MQGDVSEITNYFTPLFLFFLLFSLFNLTNEKMGKVYTQKELQDVGNEAYSKEEQDALDWIISKESGGNPLAKNPKSTGLLFFFFFATLLFW